jgi:L-asparaginase
MIQVFITGGTFDKEYNMLNGSLYFRDTHVHEMFAQGRNSAPLSIRTLMMIDSLDMTDSDRDLIVSNCARSTAQHILLTHGTDTMVKTATAIAAADLSDKTIVLTGAMIPYKFGSSDGFFNLGSALAFAQTLPAGVYIVMHGRAFVWNNVRKNTKTGYFEELA